MGAFDFLNVTSLWPDVTKEHVVAIVVLRQRLRFKIDVDASSESICNHKQGRGEVIGACVWVDSSLEITVSLIKWD